MAKENFVQLIGKAINAKISTDEQTGTPFLQFKLIVSRANRRADFPIIKVYEIDVGSAEYMISKLNYGSLVLVRGMVTTYYRQKDLVCEKCGAKKSISVLITEVSTNEFPIVLGGESDPKIFAQCCNDVRMLGIVCSNLKPSGTSGVGYQLKAERSYAIETSPEERYDYPWVKSYGAVAESCKDILARSSVVYIKGCLQTRIVEKNIKCSNEQCDGIFHLTNLRAEVLLRDVEYLHNCHFEKYSIQDIGKDYFNAS